MGASVFRAAATGNGPIVETFVVPVGQVYRVISVMLHLNTAAATSQNFTITLDAEDGPVYDTLLYALDLAAGATVNLVWQPDVDLYLMGGDGLDVAWANTDGRTWSLLLTRERV